jgi:hypothetical protein
LKGIVFNLLEQVVTDTYGEDTWESLLADADVEGVYTAVGTYPDEELHRLVAAASSSLDTPADDIIRWFGREAFSLLADRYPDFVSGHDRTIPFLLTLNDVIHPEVRKLFPGAYAPSFDFETADDDTLVLGYVSNRDLCSFAEGLVEGAAQLYGERVSIEQTSCTRRGDSKCVLRCSFARGDD